MYHAQDERQLKKVSQRKAEQEAARKFREDADARGAQATSEDDCCVSTVYTIFNAAAYVICCCGCCTSWEEYVESD